MKAYYLTPATEVIQIKGSGLLQSVSGLGLQDGGQAGGSVKPQMPGRPIWF